MVTTTSNPIDSATLPQTTADESTQTTNGILEAHTPHNIPGSFSEEHAAARSGETLMATTKVYLPAQDNFQCAVTSAAKAYLPQGVAAYLHAVVIRSKVRPPPAPAIRHPRPRPRPSTSAPTPTLRQNSQFGAEIIKESASEATSLREAAPLCTLPYLPPHRTKARMPRSQTPPRILGVRRRADGGQSRGGTKTRLRTPGTEALSRRGARAQGEYTHEHGDTAGQVQVSGAARDAPSWYGGRKEWRECGGWSEAAS
ncbi:hypothetical protein DFH09DRAFT_1330893 [Mycena vulgaris]|nr:hypothetical protein DFH09DRAFT_1330893 [Mycena vulgaris]